MAKSQPALYERFLDLHLQPGGFVMPNAWDGLSALVLKDAGFQGLGTSSAALAFTLGRLDGRPGVRGLPVTGDCEDASGETPADVAATVEAAIAAGLAGIGIEDTSGDPQK